jgi:hypothetical protein
MLVYQLVDTLAYQSFIKDIRYIFLNKKILYEIKTLWFQENISKKPSLSF